MGLWNQMASRLRGSGSVVAAGEPRVQMSARPAAAPEAGSVRGARGGNWNVQLVTPQTLTQSRETIMKRSRAAYENDSIMRMGIEKLVAALVGTGIVPQSASPDASVRKSADAAFLAWTDEASTDPGLVDFYAQQRAAVREMLVSGRAFWRIRERREADGLQVPMQLSLHDANSVSDYADGQYIRNGIDFSPATGKPTAYQFLHPITRQPSWVPADSVVHLFDVTMPGQATGLPVASSALLRLRDLDLFTDATLLRAQIANMLVGFINGSDTLMPEDSDGAIQLNPGTLTRLSPGETVTWNQPPDAAGFGEFWRSMIDAISGCFYGMPSWYLLGTTGGAETDRTMRVQLLAFRRQLAGVQHQVIAPALLKVWAAWFTAAVESGAIKLPAGAKVEDHMGVVFRVPRNEHLHPVQDSAAQRDTVRAGIRSLSSIIAENGDNPAQVFAEIAADQKALDALKLTVESDARVPAGGGAPEEPESPAPVRPTTIPGRS